MSAAALLGSYTLVSHNGKADPAAAEIKLELAAVDGQPEAVRVHAKVANAMNGTFTKQGDGKWKGMLMSTRMMGPPFHNGVEQALTVAGMEGATITKADGKLTIAAGDHTLVFQ